MTERAEYPAARALLEEGLDYLRESGAESSEFIEECADALADPDEVAG